MSPITNLRSAIWRRFSFVLAVLGLKVNLKRSGYLEYLAERVYKNKLLPKLNYHQATPQSVHGLKKVLLINTEQIRGGAAKLTFQLKQGIKQAGLRVNLLVDSKSIDDPDTIMLSGKRNRIQKDLIEYETSHVLLDLYHLSSLRIPSQKPFRDADIVHLQNLHGNYFSIFALPEISQTKPTVWTLHDTLALLQTEEEVSSAVAAGIGEADPYAGIDEEKRSFMREIRRKVYANSNLNLVVPSQWLKDKLRGSILGDKPATVIHNGIDTEVFREVPQAEARKSLGIPEGKRVLLFLADHGTSNPWKGGKFIPELKKLLAHHTDIVWLVVGGSADSREGDEIKLGYIRDDAKLAAVYSAADLFVYPSLFDNLPLAVIESMACGTPVVTFRTGGIPEIVDHQQNGWVAEYGDLSGMKAGIETFLGDKQLLTQAGISSRQKVEQKFTLKMMVDKYLAYYAEVIAKWNNNISKT